MSAKALIATSLPLTLVAKGKVRDVYDAGITDGPHKGALLFVATDRISAFDIILENVSRSHSYFPLVAINEKFVIYSSYLCDFSLWLPGNTQQGQIAARSFHLLVSITDSLHHRIARHCY